MSLPVPSAPLRPVLPSHGTATVKSVLSGDTVILTGRPLAPGQKAPVVIFTFERVTAPRCVGIHFKIAMERSFFCSGTVSYSIDSFFTFHIAFPLFFPVTTIHY
jgi:hypothetical protein